MQKIIALTQWTRRIDWILSAVMGVASMYFLYEGEPIQSLWLALGCFISALLAYLQPAKRFALWMQNKHMRVRS